MDEFPFVYSHRKEKSFLLNSRNLHTCMRSIVAHFKQHRDLLVDMANIQHFTIRGVDLNDGILSSMGKFNDVIFLTLGGSN